MVRALLVERPRQDRCRRKPSKTPRWSLTRLGCFLDRFDGFSLNILPIERRMASYSVLSAVGRLSPYVLGLATTTYDPSAHYQVRDSWFGVRTPDGH